eukprot:tig00000204_g17686.t1
MGSMDFEGQKLCERLYQAIILIFSVVGFVVGFVQQNIRSMMNVFGVGLAISCALCLVDWPFLYQRNPVSWRATEEEEAKEKRQQAQMQGAAAKNSKKKR